MYEIHDHVQDNANLRDLKNNNEVVYNITADADRTINFETVSTMSSANQNNPKVALLDTSFLISVTPTHLQHNMAIFTKKNYILTLYFVNQFQQIIFSRSYVFYL